MLKDRIINKDSGFLFYGLTPPKQNTEKDKIRMIANKQIERLKEVQIDGLVLYDIQDESSRNSSPRPFPYLPTLAPDYYSRNYLEELNIPKIIYKSIGRFDNNSLRDWIIHESINIECCVFVGSPSKKQEISLSLQDAYKLRNGLDSEIIIGGVTIPERHQKKENEHIRVFDKIDRGCSFFISQCVYNIDNSKNFISDYYYSSLKESREMVPIIFTLTPCGSVKTLEFMNWLGIDIPKWLKNDLRNSNDILSKSIDFCNSVAMELFEFCTDKDIPVGFNIESVAIRKEEIEASIELLKSTRKLMDN